MIAGRAETLGIILAIAATQPTTMRPWERPPTESIVLGKTKAEGQPHIQLETCNGTSGRIQIGGRWFDGVFDDVLQLGFNKSQDGLKLDGRYHMWNLQIENDFWNLGRHWVEFNLDLETVANDYRRFMYFGVDRDNPDQCATISFGILGTGSFTVKTATDNALMEGRELLDMDANGDAVLAGSLRVNGGGDNFGEALTVGVPESGMAVALRNAKGDDLLSVSADTNGAVRFSAASDNNAGTLAFSTHQGWTNVDQIVISNEGVRVINALTLGTNALTATNGVLFWNGQAITQSR